MSQEHIQYKHDKDMPKQKTYKKENLNYIFFFNFKNNKINNKTLCVLQKMQKWTLSLPSTPPNQIQSAQR